MLSADKPAIELLRILTKAKFIYSIITSYKINFFKL